MKTKILSLILTLLLLAVPSFVMGTTNAQPSYPPRPQIFISPASYTGTTLNSTFNYTVMIRGEDGNGVDAYWDVAGFDLTVSWNNTLINLLAYSEGNFLQQGGADTFGFYNLANAGDTYSIEAVFVKLQDPTPSSGIDSLLELEFNVTFIGYPPATCSVALDKTDLASWPHPERSSPPWNGQITAVDLPYDPLHTLDWGHSTVDATYIALAPSRELKKDAIAELQAAKQLTTNKQTMKKVDGAIGEIQESLDTGLWVDDFHLDPRHGFKVFDEEKEAVGQLLWILRNKKEGADVKNVVQSVIGKLLQVDQLLADAAIGDAKALGSTDPRVIHIIKEADKELSEAMRECAKGNYDKAVEEFKHAWMNAQHALKKAFGDVDDDGKVDVTDVAIVAKTFSSSIARPNWNSQADQNGDNKVDITDISIVCKNYGNVYN